MTSKLTSRANRQQQQQQPAKQSGDDENQKKQPHQQHGQRHGFHPRIKGSDPSQKIKKVHCMIKLIRWVMAFSFLSVVTFWIAVLPKMNKIDNAQSSSTVIDKQLGIVKGKLRPKHENNNGTATTFIRSLPMPVAFKRILKRAKFKQSDCISIGASFSNQHELDNEYIEIADMTIPRLKSYGIVDALQDFYNNPTATSKNNYQECELPSERSCGETKFTVVFLAYNPDRLEATLAHIMPMLNEYRWQQLVAEVVMVWNGPREIDESELGKKLLSIAQNDTKPLRVVYPLKHGLPNDLMNRYHPEVVNITKSKAILFYDDDGPFYSYEAILGGFELWKRHSNAQVGAMARQIRLSPRQVLDRQHVLNQTQEDMRDRLFIKHCPAAVNTTNTNKKISTKPILEQSDIVSYNYNNFPNFEANMVLPSGSILHANYLCFLWHPAFEPIRQFVLDHPVHPDDITVSMIVSQLSGRAPKVYSRRISKYHQDKKKEKKKDDEKKKKRQKDNKKKGDEEMKHTTKKITIEKDKQRGELEKEHGKNKTKEKKGEAIIKVQDQVDIKEKVKDKTDTKEEIPNKKETKEVIQQIQTNKTVEKKEGKQENKKKEENISANSASVQINKNKSTNSTGVQITEKNSTNLTRAQDNETTKKEQEERKEVKNEINNQKQNTSMNEEIQVQTKNGELKKDIDDKQVTKETKNDVEKKELKKKEFNKEEIKQSKKTKGSAEMKEAKKNETESTEVQESKKKVNTEQSKIKGSAERKNEVENIKMKQSKKKGNTEPSKINGSAERKNEIENAEVKESKKKSNTEAKTSSKKNKVKGKEGKEGNDKEEKKSGRNKLSKEIKQTKNDTTKVEKTKVSKESNEKKEEPKKETDAEINKGIKEIKEVEKKTATQGNNPIQEKQQFETKPDLDSTQNKEKIEVQRRKEVEKEEAKNINHGLIEPVKTSGETKQITEKEFEQKNQKNEVAKQDMKEEKQDIKEEKQDMKGKKQDMKEEKINRETKQSKKLQIKETEQKQKKSQTDIKEGKEQNRMSTKKSNRDARQGKNANESIRTKSEERKKISKGEKESDKVKKDKRDKEGKNDGNNGMMMMMMRANNMMTKDNKEGDKKEKNKRKMKVAAMNHNRVDQDHRKLLFDIDWKKNKIQKENQQVLNESKEKWSQLRASAVNSLVRYFGSINSGSLGWCFGTPFHNKEKNSCDPLMARAGDLPWLTADHKAKATCP